MKPPPPLLSSVSVLGPATAVEKYHAESCGVSEAKL